MDQAVNFNPIPGLLGRGKGIYACCSANEYVLRAAIRRALARDTWVLVEATANQVNQEGGYTGMTPAAFRTFLESLARQEGLPPERLLLGGDHLGLLTWRRLPEAEAMARALALVEAYAEAGFVKLHLDTSMRLGDDDPSLPLDRAVVARRSAALCAAAEAAWARRRAARPENVAPVYVVGSEVPVPGGALEDEDQVSVTRPADCHAALETFRAAFLSRGLEDAWGRVVALVVQPGVEFSDASVVEYNRQAARELTACLDRWPGLVFEGHSTDYQPAARLRELVEDGVAILKVGPALTFALREGLFALERIEQELRRLRPFPVSGFRAALEWAMCQDGTYWQDYYHGLAAQQQYARAFSLSDRARYYLPHPRVEAALHTLLDNLNREGIPLALLSQYLPVQYQRVRAGRLSLRAEDLLMDRIGDRMDDYLDAVLAEREHSNVPYAAV